LAAERVAVSRIASLLNAWHGGSTVARNFVTIFDEMLLWSSEPPANATTWPPIRELAQALQ
jgi:hypothetical protein